MNPLRSFLAVFCLCAVLLAAASPAQAQNAAPPASDTFSPSTSVPKDARTRAQVHTELGSLYFQSGNLIVALEELTIATSIDPNYAPAFSTRGLVLYYIKEYESADKDFRRALSLDEKDPEISNNYGWFLCQIGREKESIAQFQRAIKNPLYQTPEVAYLNAGTCFLKIGDLASADDYVRRSLRLSPENPKALLQLARISYQRGKYDAAAQHLKDVVRLSDPGAETLWLYLRVSRRLNDAQAESSFAAQLRRRFPDSPEYEQLLKGNYE